MDSNINSVANDSTAAVQQARRGFIWLVVFTVTTVVVILLAECLLIQVLARV